ncbi:MAG: Zn-ribbon domain-containing OB-fold protein [Acidimicrobiales bacterium]
MSELPALAPPYNPEAEPFWTAAADGRLVLPRCNACEHYIWYPRAWCPVCGNDEVRWIEVSGQGTVYACTLLHKAMGPWRDAAPFVVAYVELGEGPRILTNVVTEDPGAVRIGDAVQAVFVRLADPSDSEPVQAILRFERR